MKKMEVSELLRSLTEMTEQQRLTAEECQSLSLEVLLKRPKNNGWNVLECFEHLNRYGNYYLPLFNEAVASRGKAPSKQFKPGFLGDYFAKSMLPKGALNAMKTFKSKDPMGATLDKQAIDCFIKQQETMLEILHHAENTHLGKKKISISIAKWLKIKFGDALRFYIFHNERHMKQIARTLHEVSHTTASKDKVLSRA